MDIAVFGLGKLGLCWAAVLAEAGFRVIGIDADPKRVALINQRALEVPEAGLFDLLQSLPLERFAATTDSHLAVWLTDGCFIYVPTPSQEDGTFSNNYVLDVCCAVGEALEYRDSDYTVVVSSTVTPGSMEGPIVSWLEQYSKKECGQGFRLLYHPEFVALGQVLSGMRSPWGLLVGAQNPYDAAFVEKVYCAVLGKWANEQNMRILSWAEAELTKLFVNVFLSLKPTYANVIGEYCEKMGADPDKVTGFLGLDPRIGSQFLRCGPQPGGPCLPRDVRCAIAVGNELRTNHGLLDIIAKYEEIQTLQVIKLIRRSDPEWVGILGIAYKIGSTVTTDSFGGRIAKALEEAKIPFMVYDIPEVLAGRFEGDEWIHLGECGLKKIQEECDVVVVALPRPEFQDLDFGSFKFVIDLWRFCDPAEIAEGNLYQLGRGVI